MLGDERRRVDRNARITAAARTKDACSNPRRAVRTTRVTVHDDVVAAFQGTPYECRFVVLIFTLLLIH